MVYRTRTYIAADWESDYEAVERLREWNENRYWSLRFSDAHDLQRSRDSSLNCSIKASLRKRMDASKRFVLIVGEKTAVLRSGGCRFCPSYSSYSGSCMRHHAVDHRSYIQYECDAALKAGIDVVVLYKSASVDKAKCPERLKNVGKHVAMYCQSGGRLCWDYEAVKNALT